MTLGNLLGREAACPGGQFGLSRREANAVLGQHVLKYNLMGHRGLPAAMMVLPPTIPAPMTNNAASEPPERLSLPMRLLIDVVDLRWRRLVSLKSQSPSLTPVIKPPSPHTHRKTKRERGKEGKRERERSGGG